MTLPHANRDVPDSPPARWDARWKLAALVFAAFGVAALDRLFPSLIALALGLITRRAGAAPGKWVRGRLGLFALAALPFLLVLPFTLHTDGPGWMVGPVRVSERGLVVGLRGVRAVPGDRLPRARPGRHRASPSHPRGGPCTQSPGTLRAHRRPRLSLHLSARRGVQARPRRAANARLPHRSDSARLPHARPRHRRGAGSRRGPRRTGGRRDALSRVRRHVPHHGAFRTHRSGTSSRSPFSLCATMALLLWDRVGLS